MNMEPKTKFNLTNELYGIRNYMALHGTSDTVFQSIIMNLFLKDREFKGKYADGIAYIKDNFGLFCQYHNNQVQKLQRLKGQS